MSVDPNITVWRDALEEMEFAQDGVTMLLPREVYNAMIAVPGMEEALQRLDKARDHARGLARGLGPSVPDTTDAALRAAAEAVERLNTCNHGLTWGDCKERAQAAVLAFLEAAYEAPGETREWTLREWRKAVEAWRP